MKALTIRQPWATLIALNVKTIETRSWRAPASLIGQRIAIHAGKAKPKIGWHHTGWGICHYGNEGGVGAMPPGYRYAKDEHGVYQSSPHDPVALPLGAIVATATLADCLPMMGISDGDHTKAHLTIHDGTAVVLLGTNLRSPGDVSDQLPYGWFAPGRWAWMLSNITPSEPVPAKGKQGLWNWGIT